MLNRLTSTLLLLLLAPAVVSYGTPHDSVMVMTTQNFSTMLEDPANGLFLIKFFAPWYVFANVMRMLWWSKQWFDCTTTVFVF